MLSEQYFKNTTWPSVENIESMIPNGLHLFKLHFLLIYIIFSYRFFYYRVHEVDFLDPLQGDVL